MASQVSPIADRNLVTMDTLHRYLYMRTEVRPLDIKELKMRTQSSSCHKCHKQYQNPQVQTANPEKAVTPRISRALESFPNEVQLCTSGIPGHVYGVCARRHIPVGTWVGPYAGRKRSLEDMASFGGDSAFMWEIQHDGRLSYYLDGSDEEVSSWMRFIRCARFKGEQNLYAFQYMGAIYYRAFKSIPQGTELLVWYDDVYPQFMGIPLETGDLGTAESLPDYNANTMINASARMLPSGKTFGAVVTAHVPLREPLLRNQRAQDDDLEEAPPYKRQRVSSLEAPAADMTTIRAQSFSPQNDEGLVGNRESDGEEIPQNEERNSPVEEPSSSIFRCGQCGKAFAQKSVLQIHVCTRMPNKPYQCGYCGLAFNNPTELRAHAVAHCSEKPFKCGFCSRAFSGATTLNNHIRTHTGEKPFQCERCGKTFAQGSQLSRHQRIAGECSE